MAQRVLVGGVEQRQRLGRLRPRLDAGERAGERGLAALADRAQQGGAVGGVDVGDRSFGHASASSSSRRCRTVAWAQASRAMGTRKGEQET